MSSPIISVSELQSISDGPKLVIVDASGGPNARDQYEKSHLKGAVYIDLETQLAYTKIDPSKGGRHPLPSIHNFTKALVTLGISNDSHVVIYDRMGGGNAAARLWWMLAAVGHEKVQVLDGGFQQALKEDFPINSESVTNEKSRGYEASDWNLPMAKLEEVEAASEEGDQLIIDVRAAERFRGETEPIDLIAGHIPGAVNAPFIDNLNSEGLFKAPDVLRTQLEKTLGGRGKDKVIVHCGSGVTACHTLLAATYAGLEIPKLYVGSWSEWSRNDKKMVTKS